MREQILMNYGDFEYTINENDEVCLERYRGDVENLIIPSEIDGKKVTSIGDRAFKNCESLISIEIPDSVTSIGNSAFEDCESLISIEIPNSVTSIGGRAFLFCESLKSIEIPDSVESIGDNAFGFCKSLISIEIPDSVISVGYGIFRGCENLWNVNISDKNENFAVINNILYNKKEKSVISCFSNDSHITILSGIKKIEKGAFSSCYSLETINIPNSVISIGECAFAYCSLTSMYIPNSVIYIGERAFYYCLSLISLTIPDSVTSIGSVTFHSCYSLTIQCNAGSYAEQYCKENNLKYFTTPDWLLD